MKQDLKFFFGALIISVLGYVGFFYFSNLDRVENSNAIFRSTLRTLDGNTFRSDKLSTSQPKLIIYFNSECEHCQYEAEQIRLHYEAFNEIQLVFIAYETVEKIKDFAKTYELYDLKEIIFLEDEHLALISEFNIKKFPYVGIYSTQNQLIKAFEGPTEIEKIINAIHSHNEQH